MFPVADGSDYGGSLRNPAGWNNVFGFRTSYGLVPRATRATPGCRRCASRTDGAQCRRSRAAAVVQAGYDARAPLSIAGDGARFRRRLWRGISRVSALPGAAISTAICPLNRAFGRLQGGAQGLRVDGLRHRGGAAGLFHRGGLARLAASFAPGRAAERLSPITRPAKRALMKPEAVFEVESGLKLTAFDITAASVVRTEWYQAVRQLLRAFRLLHSTHRPALSLRSRSALAARDRGTRRWRHTTSG